MHRRLINSLLPLQEQINTMKYCQNQPRQKSLPIKVQHSKIENTTGLSLKQKKKSKTFHFFCNSAETLNVFQYITTLKNKNFCFDSNKKHILILSIDTITHL